MNPQDYFDRELEILEQQLNDGALTRWEYEQCVRDLEREYRQAAQESAAEAYEREMGRW